MKYTRLSVTGCLGCCTLHIQSSGLRQPLVLTRQIRFLAYEWLPVLIAFIVRNFCCFAATDDPTAEPHTAVEVQKRMEDYQIPYRWSVEGVNHMLQRR